MASTSNSESTFKGVLPIIPLSPLIQSYVSCSNALNAATEKLAQAKKAKPPVQVNVLRGLMDTFKIETQRLATITRKMQTVEAATPIFWDADALARQIAIIDVTLFNEADLNRHTLSQGDGNPSRLTYLIDFHHYLMHSVAHQLIYWGELLNNSVAASAVVPTVNPNKDSLVSHLIRVAYLLLNAYRDFSGFAAIMKALAFPEVSRLKKLWANCNTRTKDMFRELAQIVSPTKNYHAYHTNLRTKLESFKSNKSHAVVVVPWIQPHLLSIRSIMDAYTAGDLGILSTPGANKLDLEISILELCQHQSFTSDYTFEEIISANGVYDIKSSKRASKAIHLDGLREAVVPVLNLNHLAPGDQLIHHWLVSRPYLRKDQLINESIEVKPLKSGERITCEADEFEQVTFKIPVSKRSSFVRQPENEEFVEQELVDMSQKPDANLNTQVGDDEGNGGNDESVVPNDDDDDQGGRPLTTEAFEEQNSPVIDNNKNQEESAEQELVDMSQQKTEEDTKTVELKEMTKSVGATHSSKSSSSSRSKSKLSPSAPVFIPGSYKSQSSFKNASIVGSTRTDSETWKGYPAPEGQEDDDDDEVWQGYPGPISFSDSPRRASSQSETSEEWKGYQATKMEADWQRESELKVQQHEWQGYALETLDEDELDSSTMMNGEFEKSRKARS